MQFLHSRSVVHRDLALSMLSWKQVLTILGNLLATTSFNQQRKCGFQVKISDFGLSKILESNMYYRTDSSKSVPVKWTALEVLKIDFLR